MAEEKIRTRGRNEEVAQRPFRATHFAEKPINGGRPAMVINIVENKILFFWGRSAGEREESGVERESKKIVENVAIDIKI